MNTRARRVRLAGLLGAFFGTFIIAGGVLANDLNQSTPIAWDDLNFQGDEATCSAEDANLGALDDGQVRWHFVQTQVAEGAVLADSELTATFENAGTVTEDANNQAGGVLHWYVVTGEDSLQSASSNVTSDGPLNLSHICSNPSEGAGGGGGGGGGGDPDGTPPPTTTEGPFSNGGSSGAMLALVLLAAAGLGLLVTNRVTAPKIR